MKKLVIFDLDGTLLNTIDDLGQAANHALLKNDFPTHSIASYPFFVGNGVRKLVERALFRPYASGETNADVSDARFEQVFAEFRRWYVAHCQDNTRPYAGVMECLHSLHEKGVSMAIVSNKLQAGVTEIYDKWFAGVIDVAIGERQGVARKPARDMVDLALNELTKLAGQDFERVWYVGDSEVDVQTARNASLPCISALWGFRTREQLTAAGATHFAQQPEEIICDIEHKQEKD